MGVTLRQRRSPRAWLGRRPGRAAGLTGPRAWPGRGP